MKKACLFVSKFYQKNKVFDIADSFVNRDNCLYGVYLLRQELAKVGIDICTQDINPVSECDIIIYNEMPVAMPDQNDISKSYLLIFESEIIKPDNWDRNKHQYFHKIFTWNDDYIDNKKYFKMNFSHLIPDNIKFNIEHKKKICTLIAGNKMVYHEKELYSKRIEAIRWFEKYYPQNFDLYGIGWDEHIFYGNKLIRGLNRIKFLKKIFAEKYPSYRGRIVSKKEILSKYKFAICYENAMGIPGYITEKIFDCFFAGCVPVYWGAPNIKEFIPADVFIDKTEFISYEELYEYLITMPESEYSSYLKNIENFIMGESVKQFSVEYFADTIIKNILGKGNT